MASALQTPPEDERDLTAPDQDYTNKGIEEAENYANTHKSDESGVGDKAKLLAKSSFKRNKWKWIGVGAGGLGVLLTIGLFIFFFILFKNVHIKNLFFDYRMTQVNRALNTRLKEAIKEAKDAESDPTSDAKPSGNESTPTPDEATATPEEEMQALNPENVDALASADSESFSATTNEVQSVALSVEGDGEALDTDLKIDRSIKDADSADSKAAETNTEAELSEDSSAGDAPTTLEDAVNDAKKLQDQGLDAESAATQAVADTAGTGGALFADVVQAAQGPFIYGTFYCILRDIWVTITGSFQKVLAGGAANVAATTAKTADCQKLGNCNLNTVGALAQQSDKGNKSFTQSCGYARASGNSDAPCTELPKNYWVGALPVPDTVKDAAGIIDKISNPPLVGGAVSAVCGAVLSQQGQVIAAGLGLAAIIFSGGTASLADLGQPIAILFAGTAGKALAVHMVMDYAGGLFKNLSPEVFGGLMDMGSKSIASDTCRQAGCQKLNQQQLAAELDAYRQEKIAFANKKGFFYKYLSPDNNDSITVRVALNTPTNPSTLISRSTDMLASLFNLQKLASVLSTNWLATLATAHAGAAEDPNLYGIPAYGMPNVNQWGVLENSKWVADNGGATSLQQKYGKCFTGSFTDEINDPTCDLNTNHDTTLAHYMQYVFDQHMLHNLVLRYNNQAGNGAAAPTAPTGSTNIGQATDLANQLLNSTNVSESYNDAKQDLQLTAQGQPGTAGAPVSATILQLLVNFSQTHKIDISALESGGSGHTTGSRHYSGDAVDIDRIDGQQVTGRDPLALQLIALAVTILPSGSGFGQQGCGPPATLPAGFNEFDDTCNHLHIQVPLGTP